MQRGSRKKVNKKEKNKGEEREEQGRKEWLNYLKGEKVQKQGEV